MANSEDYLDGLLNSITKAKSENESAVQSEAIARRQRIERRTRLSADDDFMSANGLDEFEPVTSSRKNLHHFLSESDYLKQFEDELDAMETDEADEFLKEFEEELSVEDAEYAAELTESPADAFMGSVNERVSKEKKSAASDLENFSFDLSDADEKDFEEEEASEDTQEELEPEDILSGVQDILSVDEKSAEEEPSIDLMEETSEEAAEEAPLDDFMPENMPLEEAPLDGAEEILEAAEIGEEGEEATPEVEEIDLSELDLGGEEESTIGEDFLQPEFSEDALDNEDGSAEEMPELTDASVQEVPLMDESGEDVDLMDMLGDSGDLMDIGDLLSADENFEELDEARDEFEAAANEAVEEGTSLETEDEEGEGGGLGGIFGKIMGIVQGIFKKKDDEEEEDGTVEIGENAPTMEELAAEDADILSEFSDDQTPIEEDPKEKKKREKEEKKKAKQAEKEAKKKEKEAAKAAKPPKEKKEKKPKEPDNSPVIPIKGIIPILLLGLSLLALIMIGGNTIYKARTVKEAKTFYENGNYTECYSRLYPMEDSLDEDDAELLRKARILAKLELNLKEYQLAMSQEKYGEALDALVLGTYSYVRNAHDADELRINDQFNELGGQIEMNLSQQFGLTEDDAMMLARLPKRKEYTKKIHEVLRTVNLE